MRIRSFQKDASNVRQKFVPNLVGIGHISGRMRPVLRQEDYASESVLVSELSRTSYRTSVGSYY
jgi:hypothetical protein